MTDENTESYEGGVRGKSRSLKEVSSDVQKAGLDDDGTKAPPKPGQPGEEDGQTLEHEKDENGQCFPDCQACESEDPVVPEPKQKTPEEMQQDPEALLNPEEVFGTGMLPAQVDPKKWSEAKAKVEQEFGYGQEHPKYWTMVQDTYGKIVGLPDNATPQANELP